MENLRDQANRQRAEIAASRRIDEVQVTEERRVAAERLAEIVSYLKDFSPPDVPIAEESLHGDSSTRGTFYNGTMRKYEAAAFSDFRSMNMGRSYRAYTKENTPIHTMAWLAFKATSDGWGGRDGILIAENETDIFTYHDWGCDALRFGDEREMYTKFFIEDVSDRGFKFFADNETYQLIGSDLMQRGII